MRTYIMCLGVDVWNVVETGYVKPVVLASGDEKLEFSFNAKAMRAILNENLYNVLGSLCVGCSRDWLCKSSCASLQR